MNDKNICLNYILKQAFLELLECKETHKQAICTKCMLYTCISDSMMNRVIKGNQYPWFVVKGD